jgi:signal transduction histidine kinase
VSARWGRPRGRRPPWWPEGEPFPPSRWRSGGPPPFLRWVGCLFLGALLVAAVLGGFAGAAFGHQGAHPPFPFFLFPIFLVVVIVVVVARGMRGVTGPMNDLIDAARRIEKGDYSARVPEWGSRDLRSVARAFNSMSARLKTMDEQRRGFLADVTHELRTPLSVIKGQAEAIVDGVYPGDAAHIAPILDATEALDRLVEDLRTLVLTDAGNLVLKKEPTDLGTLVQETVDSFKSQAETAGVSLNTLIADDLPVTEVDPARIRGVIGNLLSNAIRHTPTGGSVAVEARAAGGAVAVTVRDTGAGIPPDLLPHVFERFVKGPSSTGSGLGLAIARDVTAAHGGKLEVGDTSSTGTTMILTLPLG